MGNQFTNLTSSSSLSIPEDCKLYSVLPINSANEEEQMLEILEKRIRLSQCPYICTVKGYDFVLDNNTGHAFTCGQSKKLIVYYDKFDYKLTDISLKQYHKYYNETQLCIIIKCVSLALLHLREHKIHHGDISLDNIVKNQNGYKLIDKVFIKNGINAYEKVLQGQSGFISPKQMVRIRYGFVKQSPELLQADDIFGLGMVILQLASEIPSSLCYKQMNIRFNQEVFINCLTKVKQKYSPQFGYLLKGMLQSQQQQRVQLDSILNHTIIKRISLEQSGPKNNQINLAKIRASIMNNNMQGHKQNISLNKYSEYHKPVNQLNSNTQKTQLSTKQHSPYMYRQEKVNSPVVNVKSSQCYPQRDKTVINPNMMGIPQKNQRPQNMITYRNGQRVIQRQPKYQIYTNSGNGHNSHRLKTMN